MVSVVIPCRNEVRYIEGLLETIRLQDAAVREVIIVDTGSVDGTADVVRHYGQQHPDFPLRWLSRPGAGTAQALNCGIREAEGDVIVRLDGHSRPRASYVGRALAALRETEAGVVGGLWEIVPGRPSIVADAIAGAVSHPVGAGDAAYRTGVAHQRRLEVDTVPFGCFRKATWEEIGGFNDALLANEDYEFNYRVRSGGRAVVLDPGMGCEYFARGRLRDLAAQYFRYGWWKAKMLKRYPGAIRWRQAVPAALIPFGAVLVVLSLVWPGAARILTALALVYLATVAASAVHIGARRRRWSLLVPLIAAFIVIHVAWSAGFSVSVATGGRWPVWRARTTSPTLGGQQGFTALTLLLALLAILILTLVVPPGVATLVNRSRIARAQAGAEALAETVRRLAGETGRMSLETIARAHGTGMVAELPDVLVGPGEVPKGSDGSAWTRGRVVALDPRVTGPIRPDPWGNRYLINVGVKATRESSAGPPPAVWVLSAGTNGIIETPFEQAAATATLRGDDIGARLR